MPHSHMYELVFGNNRGELEAAHHLNEGIITTQKMTMLVLEARIAELEATLRTIRQGIDRNEDQLQNWIAGHIDSVMESED